MTMLDGKGAELFDRIRASAAEFEADPASFDKAFEEELATVRRLWLECGYRPGIAAYLNFFLLEDFIELHDRVFPPRFASFRSMADSFYETDLFVRAVTDSGVDRSDGIRSAEVRKLLHHIMERHRAVKIPDWMMTYFGWSLLENVEKQVGELTEEEKRLHLRYMARTYRIMGVPFSADRELMESYAGAIEERHAGVVGQLEKHARNILVLGEMVGASSAWNDVGPMLSPAARRIFEPVYPKVRPGAVKRVGARVLGRLLMKRAVGADTG